MRAELSSWLPLCDLAAMLFVLGIASTLLSRDRRAWWVSQGLLLLGIVLGFVAASAIHSSVDLFSLGVWIPLAWAIRGITIAPRLRSTNRVTNYD